MCFGIIVIWVIPRWNGLDNNGLCKEYETECCILTINQSIVVTSFIHIPKIFNHIYVSMYVCIYACIYACIYVCIYVCMYHQSQ